MLYRVPLAPPHTLVLSANEFRNFRSSSSLQSPAVAASGDALSLRKGGAALRGEFEDTVLADGLSELLQPSLPSWKAWVASLDCTAIDDAATSAWLQEYEQWAAQVAIRKAEREERRKTLSEAGIDGGGVQSEEGTVKTKTALDVAVQQEEPKV